MNPWLTAEGRTILESTLDAEIAEQLDQQVRRAVDTALGIPPMSIEEAARHHQHAADKILEALGECHSRDLAAAEVELLDELHEHLPNIDEALLLVAADETIETDRRTHRVARAALADALPAAIAEAPMARKREVTRLLEAEHARLDRRRAARLPRAVGVLKQRLAVDPEELAHASG